MTPVSQKITDASEKRISSVVVYPEDGSCIFLRHAGKFKQDYKASHSTHDILQTLYSIRYEIKFTRQSLLQIPNIEFYQNLPQLRQ